MKLKFSVDTEDLEEEMDFDTLFTDSLRKEIINGAKANLGSEKFKEFAKLASDNIVTGIKLKLEHFLSEEIALVDQWGKKFFVGSVEDLIKKRFDDILLRPVDSAGRTLTGCALSKQTWIEWKLERALTEEVAQQIKVAEKEIKYLVKEQVKERLIVFKDGAVKEQVDAVFTSVLQTKGGTK